MEIVVGCFDSQMAEEVVPRTLEMVDPGWERGLLDWHPKVGMGSPQLAGSPSSCHLEEGMALEGGWCLQAARGMQGSHWVGVDVRGSTEEVGGRQGVN